MVIEVWNIVHVYAKRTINKNQQRKKFNSFPLEFQQFNEHIIANMDKHFLYQKSIA
jgi:hypothetical protein